MKVAKTRRHGQGSIWTEKRARGHVFVGQVSVNGRLHQRVLGPERRAGEKDGLTRAGAEARLREVRAEIEADAGTRMDLTLRDAGERYLAHIEARRNLKRATLQDYWLYLRRHLTGPQAEKKQGTRPVKSPPFFEDRLLASITKADANRYVDRKVAEGLAARTIDAHLTLLSAIYSYAVEQAWTTSNPVVAVERPRPDDPDEVTDGPRSAHTIEQVAAVLRACDAFDRCLFTTAYYTGMRLGELIALKWRDVDLVANVIHVRRSWSRGAETTTKSRKRRIVPVAPTVAHALAQHAAFTNYGSADDRVFAHPASGKALDEGWVRAGFMGAQRRACVPVYKMHDTRSTFTTILWSRGEPISTLQTILGHADVRTTTGYIVGYHERGDEGTAIEQAFQDRLTGARGS